MQPKRRPSMDGMRRPTSNTASKRKPDYRPDHELPAPEPTPLLDAPDQAPTLAPSTKSAAVTATDIDTMDAKPELSVQQPRRKKRLVPAIAALIVAVVALVAGYIWYQIQLAPVSTDAAKSIRLAIKSGTAPAAIASQLQSSGVIRSEFAFGVHTKLTGTENNLKAGIYNFKPSQSTPAIVDQLVAGSQDDAFRVTFLPGDTLANSRKSLLNLGLYSEAEIDAALDKTYDRPLFAGKPADADLEGYLYGETLEFDSSATVESILEKFFDHYEEVIVENDLVAAFEKRGLTLYEGITLASIVQREVSSKNPSEPTDDQKKVAEVFYNRMAAGMTLGSDVTYQYIADKTGVARDPGLDSPYNTRRYAGLPPGPIASPGAGALLAVANPVSHDFLFFLSGDDDKTYFAKTDAGHQQNIVKYCKVKCLII